jgi:hypothetical protein
VPHGQRIDKGERNAKDALGVPEFARVVIDKQGQFLLWLRYRRRTSRRGSNRAEPTSHT